MVFLTLKVSNTMKTVNIFIVPNDDKKSKYTVFFGAVNMHSFTNLLDCFIYASEIKTRLMGMVQCEIVTHKSIGLTLLQGEAGKAKGKAA